LSFLQLLALSEAVTNHTRDHEPSTLSYQLYAATPQPVGPNDQTCTQLVIFERYTDKAALDDVHMKSDAFKAFVGAVQADPEALRSGPPIVVHYEEQQIGFVGAV
jgi:quinol monooxygenase YgiN